MSNDRGKIRFGLWYDFRNPIQWRQPADRLYREILRTSPPIGIGGQPMPGGITTNSRAGFAASRPSAGFRIPSANCWISPGATMSEPIGSAAEPKTDDR